MQETLCAAHIPSCGRTPSSPGETLGRNPAEPSAFIVDRAELGAIAVRRLEVIADDLLVLHEPFGRGALEPTREALVQLGT